MSDETIPVPLEAELDALFIGAGLRPAGRSVVPGLWGGVAVSVAVAP